MIAYRFRNSKYPPGHAWRPYFIPGLTVKLIGGIFIGLIYQYYYGGGDTAHYFLQSKIINSAFFESPVKWFKLLLHLPEWYDPAYSEYISRMMWYESRSNYIVSSACALVGVFCFNTFLPCTVMIAAITYTGVWALFRTFATQYPTILKYIAVALLFIPSVFMWGSGIFKDTLCLFALGWLTRIVFNIFIQGRISLGNLLLLMLSFYIIYTAKIYILIAYVPSLLLWVMLNYSARIKFKFAKVLLQVGVVGLAIVGFVMFNDSFSEELGRYSLDNIAKTSTETRDYIAVTTGDAGSGYDLGSFDPSLTGMLKKMPQAINVSLFRPYLWEAGKPIVMLNAIEAFLIMMLTLRVLFQIGPIRMWKAISEDANIQFCLIFSLIFAFAVGISSYNFGSLSRYRIPCIPTFVLSLILIYYKYKSPEQSIFKLRNE
jgi:hypothetical protein